MKTLGGVIIPAITPFDETGKMRLDWAENNYRKWSKTGIKGCMILGSNGEFRALDDDESFALIRTASETVTEDKVLMVGVARESLYQTLKFMDRIFDAQIRPDYVSVITPGYFRKAMTDRALIDYYQAVADRSEVPVLLYCAPVFANEVCISAEAVKVLADHPNILGIKDTSTQMMEAYFEAVGGREDFLIFSGTLGRTMDCLRRGGAGGVLSAGNYFPESCAKLYSLYEEKGIEVAGAWYEKLKGIVKQTGGRAGVAGVKATMNVMGYCGGIPRLPLPACDEQTVDAIKAAIQGAEGILLDCAEL